MKKGLAIGGIITALIVLVAAGAIYFRYAFVFGEGVKAGVLNRLVYKGYIFKTYEGYIIQDGISSRQLDTKGSRVTTGTAIQSNEFYFSVVDKSVADSLMYHCGGKKVQLHYKEYKGTLPWRGQEKFIVDRIISVEEE